MNTRDPFNIRRSPGLKILQGTARLAATSVTHKVLEAGQSAYESSKQAVLEEMATFSIPKNVPSFTNPQRELENRSWGSSGVTARSANSTGGSMLNGVQDRVGNYFEKNKDLPMYKDKPYASSRRAPAFYKRTRIQGAFLAFVVLVLYFLGVFGDGEQTSKSKGDWSFLSRLDEPETSSGVDWLERREKVKEAFTLSWDAYKRYGWGACILS